ncbi:uncharacterized protein LOC132047749 [Lycium ferocissimum]|uniref:uncharacterized protein LOC132047749 n=1 Tax=Lycium ferocissimum TaxID=112874 RepID=UPI002814B461|nr:uncharacterized protein LOC132047749 [Lycium ferocissimum]
MRVLQEKLKDLSRELSHWSKTSIGDIYEKVKFYEKIVKDKENIMDADPSEKIRQDLNKMAAEYTRYLGLQSSILQQKANLQWKEEGDSCSKYFFSVIKQKRRRNYIHRIQDENGYWIEDPNDIGNTVVRFYSNLFSNDSQQNGDDFGALNQLHSIISREDNEMLTRMPEEEEIFGFISDRLITENVILTQKIVHNMSKNKKKENMIIKLDMEKAYDRVSWAFLYVVLEKMGFNDTFIDIIRRLVENAWYSVMINGDRKGFFHSSRGLKQGDPLSPSLFVISAEILSRMLNNLFDNRKYTGFTMEAKGPQINHLAYTDDVVIFTSWKEKSLRRVMRLPYFYRKEKDMLFHIDDHQDFKESWGLARKSIVIWRETVIIQQVLQSQTMHLLAAISPPKYVLTQIEKYLQDFFWGEKEGKKKHYWAAWKYLCYPKDESGAGFKSLVDIQTSFAMKRWWRLRIEDNLWTKFMNAKYCKRVNLVARKWTSGQSQSWKELMLIKQDSEPHMLWQINKGNVLFWWDNWIGLGPLSMFVNRDIAVGNTQVKELIIENRWNNERLQTMLNTDGSSMSRANKAGGGGILRDHHGNLIMAFTASMNFCSNNMAETQAANCGLKWCQQNNIHPLILEMDSKIVVDMINGTSKPTWKLQHWIAEIQDKVLSKLR